MYTFKDTCTHTQNYTDTIVESHVHTQRHTPSLLGKEKKPCGSSVLQTAFLHTHLPSGTCAAKVLPTLTASLPSVLQGWPSREAPWAQAPALWVPG